MLKHNISDVVSVNLQWLGFYFYYYSLKVGRD